MRQTWTVRAQVKMPRVFGEAPIVGRSTAFVEHLDLFPTLVELAMGAAVPRCPAATHENRATLLCTEGLSFAPLLRPAGEPKPAWKAASFSQFPRYGCWADPPAGCGSVMGYSMRRHNLRYTEWVAFNTSNAVDKLSGPDWAELVVRAAQSSRAALVRADTALLRAGRGAVRARRQRRPGDEWPRARLFLRHRAREPRRASGQGGGAARAVPGAARGLARRPAQVSAAPLVRAGGRCAARGQPLAAKQGIFVVLAL